jgi:hypothetical protein
VLEFHEVRITDNQRVKQGDRLLVIHRSSRSGADQHLGTGDAGYSRCTTEGARRECGLATRARWILLGLVAVLVAGIAHAAAVFSRAASRQSRLLTPPRAGRFSSSNKFRPSRAPGFPRARAI